MDLIEQLLCFIAPHQCLGCGVEGCLLCKACVSRLEPVPSRCYSCGRPTEEFRTCSGCRPVSCLSHVWAAAQYKGLAKDIVGKLKFQRAGAAAEDIARIVSARLPTGRDWLVTFVPTANSRVRQRGYDQAQRIAKQVARHLGCVYAPLLARRGSQRQLGQGRAARKQQMQTAFVFLHTKAVREMKVLLIDDVSTTGATLEAAANVLKAAGARQVSAAVFAAA